MNARIIYLVIAQDVLQGNSIITGAFWEEERARTFAGDALGKNTFIHQIKVL